MTNLWVVFSFCVFLVDEQTALNSQRKRVPRYSVHHHKRSSDPMYKYQPHLDPEGCEEPPTSLSTVTTSPSIVGLGFPTVDVHKSQRAVVQKPLLHKHLLLVTGQVHQEYIGQCSMAVQAQDLSDLDAKLRMSTAVVGELPLNDFVVVQVGTGWRPDIRILDVVADHLGNVSLYTDIRYLSKTMNKHCGEIGIQRCSLLTSLTPVLEQLEPANVWPGVYDPDWIPVPALPPLSSALYAQSTEKQIEYLTWRLCVRDRRHNLYYKLDKDSPLSALSEPKDVAETENPVFETSLSLNDILPVNPKNYDKNRAPKVQGQPTIVYFHVTVLSLDSINEESMTYVADIFLAQSWRDPRLRMPENMSEEYRILDVDWLHQIWRPDCFFKNAKKVTFHEMSIPNHYLWLYHDKTLLYMSKLTLVLSCAMKFESYPHDTQICTMMIESLSHTTHDLVFIWNMTDPLVVNPEIELPQLDISNNVTSDCTIQYSTGNFTCLAVVFNLRRRLGYHLFHTYIPSALIVVMSWISFWIKPEAIPARVTLGVTSLLTLATQNTQSQQSLPPVSYVKAIDIWMSSCSIFVFLSLMEFAVVNNYMGPVATKVMKGYSDDDVRGGDELSELDPKSRNAMKNVSAVAATPQYPTFCNGRAIALYIDKFSRFFFPFSFFLLNVAYWTSFL